MTADARHFCPDCGGIDLAITKQFITLTNAENSGSTAKCPNCGWAGTLADTVGAASREGFWDIDRVGHVLLRVVAKHTAGPFIQVMEFVGLLPRARVLTPEQAADPKLVAEVQQHNEIVESARDGILHAVIGAAITAGFEEAEQWHRVWAVKMNKPLDDLVKHGSSGPKDREFGGN